MGKASRFECDIGDKAPEFVIAFFKEFSAICGSVELLFQSQNNVPPPKVRNSAPVIHGNQSDNETTALLSHLDLQRDIVQLGDRETGLTKLFTHIVEAHRNSSAAF